MVITDWAEHELKQAIATQESHLHMLDKDVDFVLESFGDNMMTNEEFSFKMYGLKRQRDIYQFRKAQCEAGLAVMRSYYHSDESKKVFTHDRS